jgi:uncharacterized membrane protein (DUF2068 family)
MLGLVIANDLHMAWNMLRTYTDEWMLRLVVLQFLIEFALRAMVVIGVWKVRSWGRVLAVIAVAIGATEEVSYFLLLPDETWSRFASRNIPLVMVAVATTLLFVGRNRVLFRHEGFRVG